MLKQEDLAFAKIHLFLLSMTSYVNLLKRAQQLKNKDAFLVVAIYSKNVKFIGSLHREECVW